MASKHAARKLKLDELIAKYRVTEGKGFKLKDFDPADTNGFGAGFKDDAEALLAQGVEKLADLQDKLYAQDRWAVLLVFQAMDAAGKDGTIKHVMSGINPQGCQVVSFKQPSAEELDHDYMWRYAKNTPERGRIGIFNRSYYEEVLVVRVHEQILRGQRMPPQLVDKHIWRDRLEDIVAYERYLARNGVAVVKFFLNVSREEQKRRFLERLDEPEKNWKFSAADVTERSFWNDYQKAYQDAIRATAGEHAPWYVVPADNKWYTRLIVAAAVVDRLQRLDLAYPELDKPRKQALLAARQQLTANDD